MKNWNSNYYKTIDNEQIFYKINFDPDDLNENVLIFNYGLACSNHHWSKQVPYFESLGYKILLHDYRGHFKSSGIDRIQDITFPTIARDIKGICNHLNIKSSIQFGHSMGVNITLEVARRYPEIIDKLILISGTIVPVYNIMLGNNIMDLITPKLKELVNKYPEIAKGLWSSSGWNPIVKKLIHFGGFNLKEVDSEFVEIYINKLAQLGPDLFFQLFEQMNEHDISPFLSHIEQRTLIIGGDNDKVIPNFLQSLALKEIKNSELYIVRNGSHVPQVDFPDFVNERIQAFIA